MKRMVILLFGLVLLLGCEKPKAEKTEQTPAANAAEAEKAEDTEQAAKEQPTTAPSEEAEQAKQGPVEDIAAGEKKLYGANFTVIEPPISLSDALEKAGEHEGPYKVEATIDAVCKKKGCWFTLVDDGTKEPVRVRMKGYGFFVPRNSDGATAIVEGTIARRTIPQAEAQHYADDQAEAGEEPRKVDGPQEVFEFTATSVQVHKT